MSRRATHALVPMISRKSASKSTAPRAAGAGLPMSIIGEPGARWKSPSSGSTNIGSAAVWKESQPVGWFPIASPRENVIVHELLMPPPIVPTMLESSATWLWDTLTSPPLPTIVALVTERLVCVGTGLLSKT